MLWGFTNRRIDQRGIRRGARDSVEDIKGKFEIIFSVHKALINTLDDELSLKSDENLQTFLSLTSVGGGGGNF